MIHFISGKIVDGLIENGTIVPEEKDLYFYGLQQGLTMIVNILTTVAIGFVFKMVWQSIVFMLNYIPLRSFAGGFHAKTQLRCHLFSIVLIIVALLGMKMIPWNIISILFITLLASTTIILLAPMEDFNKPLNQKERILFKKCTMAILCLSVSITVMSWFTGYMQFSISVMMAILTLSFMLLIGKIVRKYTKTNLTF